MDRENQELRKQLHENGQQQDRILNQLASIAVTQMCRALLDLNYSKEINKFDDLRTRHICTGFIVHTAMDELSSRFLMSNLVRIAREKSDRPLIELMPAERIGFDRHGEDSLWYRLGTELRKRDGQSIGWPPTDYEKSLISQRMIKQLEESDEILIYRHADELTIAILSEF